MPKGDKPTHVLCMKPNADEDSPFITVGVGWEHRNGSVGIKLNVGVNIDWHDTERLALYLFVKKDYKERG